MTRTYSVAMRRGDAKVVLVLRDDACVLRLIMSPEPRLMEHGRFISPMVCEWEH